MDMLCGFTIFGSLCSQDLNNPLHLREDAIHTRVGFHSSSTLRFCMRSLPDFPPEILCMIFRSLSPQDLGAASATCEQLKSVAYSMAHTLYFERFGAPLSNSSEFSMAPGLLWKVAEKASLHGYPPRKDADNTALAIWACQENHKSLITDLARSYPFDEGAALRLSLAFGHVECVKAVLQRVPPPSPGPDRISPSMKSPLVLSIARDSVELLALLLNHFPTHDLDTLLLIASRLGCEQTAAWLIQRGANPNCRKVQLIRGQYSLITPVSECAQQNHTSLLQLLLRSGADPQPKSPRVPYQCALHWALRNRNLQMVSDLVEAGANIEANDSEGCTALMLAAAIFPSAAILLLQKGANIFAFDTHRNSVLHFAAASNESGSLIVCISERYRDAFVLLMSARNSTGNTPLVIATYHNNQQTAQLMLEQLQRSQSLKRPAASATTISSKQTNQDDQETKKENLNFESSSNSASSKNHRKKPRIAAN